MPNSWFSAVVEDPIWWNAAQMPLDGAATVLTNLATSPQILPQVLTNSTGIKR